MKKNLAFATLALVAFCAAASAQAKRHKGATAKTYSLQFDAKHFTADQAEYNGTEVKYRVYRDVVYVAHPVDVNYQCMNIYVPQAYYEGRSVNGYTAATAPIFLPNNVGGYMPATPGTMTTEQMPTFKGKMPDMKNPPAGMRPMRGRMPSRPNTILAALSKGYVVASPGVRGRTLKDGDGHFYGKAPALIVDIKAAVRYLRHNDRLMPGNAERIISNGTSAGGALSALLGATGNSADYLPYLNALGAAPEPDNIFAVSAYCPITNLDHADMAYEWLFNGVNSFRRMAMGGMIDFHAQRTEVDDSLSALQIAVSGKLKALFPAYVNSLGLRAPDGTALTLDADGNGPFKAYVMQFVIASAQKALDQGTDLSQTSWLTVADGKVTAIDFDKYVHAILRMKTPPAFDALDLSTGENNEFGTATVDNQHFTAFGMANTTVPATMADTRAVKMLNPMNYIGQKGVQPAKYWRLRHGTIDRDGSIAVPVILATRLQNCGYSVDIALPWNTPHSGDYDLDELFRWIDSICK